MVIMATSMSRTNYTCNKNIIWISFYDDLKRIPQIIIIFYKIWKIYLEWYTSALGVEYLSCCNFLFDYTKTGFVISN